MYRVRITTEQDGVHRSETIIETHDRHQAELAFEGTVLSVKYHKKGTEEIEPNKYVLHGTDDKVIVTLKEEQHDKRKEGRHDERKNNENRTRRNR